MYKAAIVKAGPNSKAAATTICNYAVFLYRNKKSPEEAAALFCEGLERFV
jgi:hypothetical protein